VKKAETSTSTKKGAAAPCSETAGAKKLKKIHGDVFCSTLLPYYVCKFGLNRLRIDGDIRQKAAITAIMENGGNCNISA